jgi:hypothetical protein
MFAESLTTIFFRLLNFAALMWLFVYIFKKYMQKDIEESIEHDRLEEINVNAQISEGGQRSSELSDKIINQEKLCIYLVTRADQWKIAFEKEVQEKHCAQQVLQQQVIERAKLQAQAITQQRVIQTVLPHAVKQAREQLAYSFADDAKSKEFVQAIITHMEKGT